MPLAEQGYMFALVAGHQRTYTRPRTANTRIGAHLMFESVRSVRRWPCRNQEHRGPGPWVSALENSHSISIPANLGNIE